MVSVEGNRLSVDRRVGLQLGHRGPGRELVDLGLAAGHLELPGVVVGHVGPGHAVQVRLARLPVVGVLDELERAALVPVVELERAGADRRVVERGRGLAAVVVGHDAVGEQRQVGQDGRPLVLQVDHHRVGGRGGHRLDGGVDVAPALGGGHRLLQAELHVLGRHGRAVGELDPLPQRDGVRQLVLRDGVAGREPRRDALAVAGDGEQRLGDLLDDPDRVVVEDSRFVERLCVLRVGEDEVPARDRRAGAGGTTTWWCLPRTRKRLTRSRPAPAGRQPAVRAMVRIGLCLTSSSGELRSDGYVAKRDDMRAVRRTTQRGTRPCVEGGTALCPSCWAKVCANLCPTL